MPRKPDELRAQIKRLEAVVKADNADRRDAEAPLRKARGVLRDRVRKLKCNLSKATARREQMLADGWKAFRLTPLTEQEAKFLHGSKWNDTESSIAKFAADLASAELDLALFHETHRDLTT
jgi:hypothetical protein